MASNSRVTAQQLALLNQALELGILSPVKHQEVLEWDQQERSHRAALASTPIEVQPVRPRFSSEVSVKELAVQIALRELQIANELPAGPYKHREEEYRKGKLDSAQKSLAELKATKGIYPPSQKSAPVGSMPKVQPPARPPMPDSARTALELLLELQTVRADLSFVATNVVQQAVSELGAIDAELCLRWNNIAFQRSSESDVAAWIKLEELEAYRQSQVLSARSAELITHAYYSKLGFDVEDVSILQLDGSTEDWKAYDLRVGDRFVDVKNARKSLHGTGHFVEHCVPRFKQLRATGDHIAIAGVLSDYWADPHAFRQGRPEATVLGEVNVLEVRALYSWARTRFGARLDLKGIWDPGFLPGWIFEYPEAHYPRRKEAIKSIAPMAWRLAHAGALGDQLPGWLLILCDDDAFIKSLPLEAKKRRIIEDLRSMAAAIGITRRSLYVYAMGIALEALADEVSPEEDLRSFIALLETPAKDQITSKLGLDDPLAYVGSIADHLCEIGRRLLEAGIHLTGFRLTHPAILKGVCSDGTVMTLMAYCGGWQTVPVRAKCGTVPLTIVDDASCSSCGHLICHNCGHCSNFCHECSPRQSDFAKHIQSEEPQQDYEEDLEDFLTPYFSHIPK